MVFWWMEEGGVIGNGLTGSRRYWPVWHGCGRDGRRKGEERNGGVSAVWRRGKRAEDHQRGSIGGRQGDYKTVAAKGGDEDANAAVKVSSSLVVVVSRQRVFLVLN